MSQPQEILANHICWYTTSHCNYGCHFCYRYLTNDRIKTTSEAINIIDKLISLGANRITFTGEPILVPWIKNALEYSLENGLFTTLMTNGSLLDEHWIDYLKKIRLNRISLPVDGSNNFVNDQMTRNHEHFSRIEKILSILSNTEIIIKITTVISKVNVFDISNIAEFLEKSGVDQWKIYQFRADHEIASRNKSEFEISDDDFSLASDLARAVFQKENKVFKKVSLKDRYSDFFQILSNGDLEMTFGNSYRRLGNLLDDSINILFINYQNTIYEKESEFNTSKDHEVIKVFS